VGAAGSNTGQQGNSVAGGIGVQSDISGANQWYVGGGAGARGS
jgi:hypothetical protein